jgi:alkanesulfonate monooxygenase SsuD/methylene tetrahydromethanopterin reductase-like flavin-dependent oxidoreductase (luciferase family)
MGLPYAFASHFAPAQFRRAIAIYRSNFKPSKFLDKPKVMACVNVIAADTDKEASDLFNSLIGLFIGIITNTRKPLGASNGVPEAYHNPEIKNAVNSMLACSFYGSKVTLKTSLSEFIDDTGIDELMVATHIFDLDSKLKSFTILKEAMSMS